MAKRKSKSDDVLNGIVAIVVGIGAGIVYLIKAGYDFVVNQAWPYIRDEGWPYIVGFFVYLILMKIFYRNFDNEAQVVRKKLESDLLETIDNNIKDLDFLEEGEKDVVDKVIPYYNTLISKVKDDTISQMEAVDSKQIVSKTEEVEDALKKNLYSELVEVDYKTREYFDNVYDEYHTCPKCSAVGEWNFWKSEKITNYKAFREFETEHSRGTNVSWEQVTKDVFRDIWRCDSCKHQHRKEEYAVERS